MWPVWLCLLIGAARRAHLWSLVKMVRKTSAVLQTEMSCCHGYGNSLYTCAERFSESGYVEPGSEGSTAEEHVRFCQPRTEGCSGNSSTGTRLETCLRLKLQIAGSKFGIKDNPWAELSLCHHDGCGVIVLHLNSVRLNRVCHFLKATSTMISGTVTGSESNRTTFGMWWREICSLSSQLHKKCDWIVSTVEQNLKGTNVQHAVEPCREEMRLVRKQREELPSVCVVWFHLDPVCCLSCDCCESVEQSDHLCMTLCGAGSEGHDVNRPKVQTFPRRDYRTWTYCWKEEPHYPEAQ